MTPDGRTCMGAWPRPWLATLVATALALCPSRAAGDTILSSFTSGREDWEASGPCHVSSSGLISDGAVGQGASHSANFDLAGYGIKDQADIHNLSGFGAIRVAARFVPEADFQGSPELVFKLEVGGDNTWAAPPQPLTLTSQYQTYTFSFASLKLDPGDHGALDLSQVRPRFLVFKNGSNGQSPLSGHARLDFDEVTEVDPVSDGYSLTPVVLYPVPDGDFLRGMWLYPSCCMDDSDRMQAILNFSAQQGVNAIYCDAYGIWQLGSFGQQNHLRKFLTAAHLSGIRVEALGDPKNWLTDGGASVRDRLDEVLAFHKATPTFYGDDFDAYHFDVEFWTLPAWKNGTVAARQAIAETYLTNVVINARDHLDASGGGGMEVDVDLASSLDDVTFTHNTTTQPLLGHVLDTFAGVVILSYVGSDDPVTDLVNATKDELNLAAGKTPSRNLQLAADIQPAPPASTYNSFWDNPPGPLDAMNTALSAFHGVNPQPSSLIGFSIWQYTGYSASAAPPGPVLHLTFDDPGNPGRDVSNYGHDGILGSPLSMTDGYCPIDGSRSVHFCENNNIQEFHIPDHDDLNLVDDMTGMAWIRPRGTHSPDGNQSCTEGTIFAKGGQMWFQVQHDNQWLEFQNEGSGVDIARSVNVSIPLDEWTHVAVVRTGAGDGWDISFYVNGEPVQTVVPTGHLTHDPLCNPYPVMVGNYGFLNNPGACEFNGDIDQIKLFRTPLSPEAVKEEYESQRCFAVPGLSVTGGLWAAVLLACCGGVALHRRRASRLTRPAR